MHPHNLSTSPRVFALAGAALAASAFAQSNPTASTDSATKPEDEEVVVLSPFEVTAEETKGYVATSTLAGSRLNTQLKDVGSAVSVVTSEFLKDTGATDNKTLLQYTTATEVGGSSGNFANADGASKFEDNNFANPNSNTRVRGLTSADGTRNFFMSDIPWDAYNVDRVDMQRGPNAVLYGMGSPAGIINTSTKTAQFRNFGEAEFRYGSYGTNRMSLDVNQQILEDELAVRVALLKNDEQYKQEPAYSLDKRVFATARYEPKFLNRNGIKTTLKVNYEAGRVRSNNPRSLTPLDYITPWFTDMNKATYDPRTVQSNTPYTASDGSTYYPANYGQTAKAYSNGTANPYYQPWLGNFAQSYGGLLAIYNNGSSDLSSLVLSEFANIKGISSTGAIDGGIDGFSYSRRVAVDGYANYMFKTGGEWAKYGLYKDKTLSDSSIFDFYNTLLDGNTKKEWQNFNNFSTALSQTFFNGKLGYELAYDKQSYTQGQYTLLSTTRAGLYVDINAYNLDGTANTNVGKAFISDAGQYGNYTNDITREAARLTLFFDHDFTQGHKGEWFRKILGHHTITGLYSQESWLRDSRSFLRYGTDLEYLKLVYAQPELLPMTDNLRSVNQVIYLSDDLSGLTSASQANISTIASNSVPSTAQMYYFNSTWNATGVDPAAAWTNPVTGAASTQSENPANYIGWSKVTVNILQAEKGDQDALTTSARLNKRKTNSRAAIWQGHLWDDAIVGMYGIRHDTVKAWSYQASTYWDVYNTKTNKMVSQNLGRVNWGAADYSVSGDPSVTEKNNPTWSVVLKTDNVFHNIFGKHLPFELNFFYNESSNFQIESSRKDVYGNDIPLPSGDTTDKGIMIGTRDDRYTLKINRFESSILNATGSSLSNNMWFIGSWLVWGGNYADIFEYHLGSTGDISTANGSPTWRWTWSPKTGQTTTEAYAERDSIIAAFRTLQASLPTAYLNAFNFKGLGTMQVGGITYTAPSNLSVTEDQVSKGWEFEFTANITPNWRVTANAARVEAIRNNVGGAALTELVGIINTALNETDAGDLRIWSGGATATTMLYTWNSNFYSYYSLMKLLEGQSTPEMRKWRFNLITSYDFSKGWLKGVTVGAGYRWQDKNVIGYKPLKASDTGVVTYDLENPYYGPTEDGIDFWIGYGRKLTNKINWRVQLNVRNVGDGNKLIPVTCEPDGSIAAWRIAPCQTWTLTNTFTF